MFTSRNCMGRTTKPTIKERLMNRLLFIFGKVLFCKIKIYYAVQPSKIYFSCIVTSKKVLKQDESREVSVTGPNWHKVPYFFESSVFYLNDTGTIKIEVGGFFACLPETHKDTMAITVIRNTSNTRVFPVQFTRPKTQGNEDGILHFFGEADECIHTVYFGKELLPAPPVPLMSTQPTQPTQPTQRRRPNRVRQNNTDDSDSDDNEDDTIPDSDLSPHGEFLDNTTPCINHYRSMLL